jgi:integrase
MATVIRRTKGMPIPANAKIRMTGGKRCAHWTDAKGKTRKAPLSKDGTKIVVRSATYSIRYKDENGLLKWQSSGTRDKDAAKQIANQLESRAAKIRQGLIDPAEDLFAKAARRPLEGHLADYVDFLRHKGNTTKHVRLTQQRIRQLLEEGKIGTASGLTESAVRAAIDRIRTAPELVGKPPLGLGALNGYLRAVIGFANWLHKDRRTPHRPLLGFSLFNAETDRRHLRRSMSVEELQWLLKVTETRPAAAHHASGEDRAMCYLLAATTGYRAGELKSLTTNCFDLDGASPVIALEAARSKRRKQERQPVPAGIVPKLRAWLEKKPPGSRVFASIPGDTARMIRSDLQAAREAWLAAAGSDQQRAACEATDFLRYLDSQGRRLDFHSLRMTYVTLLSAGNIDVKTLQELARHSTPVLTMNTYNQRTRQQLAGPVDQLGQTLMDPLPKTPAGSVAGDYKSDYSQQAGGASGWQSGASAPVDREQASTMPANEKTPAKPGEGRAPQGSSVERLRSESNRRWRICNPLP